jgi:hypothetical protein
MKTGEIIKQLITTDNYLETRMDIGDDFIELVKDFMPHDYEYLREREEAYQSLLKLFKQ